MKDRSTSSSTSKKEKPMRFNGFFGLAVFVIVVLVFLIVYIQNFSNPECDDCGGPMTDPNYTVSSTTNSSSVGSIGLPYSKGPSGPPENLSQPTTLPPSSND